MAWPRTPYWLTSASAATPMSGRIPSASGKSAKATNLSEYTIRMVFDKLIDEGRLTRMAGHESQGVVLP